LSTCGDLQASTEKLLMSFRFSQQTFLFMIIRDPVCIIVYYTLNVIG